MKLLTRIIQITLLTAVLVGCNQESVDDYLERGKQFSANKEWKSAIIEFKNAVKLEPENAQARAELGQAYTQTFSSNAAIKELSRAIDLGYNKDELIIPLAKSYRQINQSQNILDNITVNDSQSKNTQALVNAYRGIAYLRLDQKDEAKKALSQASDIDSSLAEVRIGWAELEGVNNNIEAQRKWIMPLISPDAGNADAWSILAGIEHRSRNLKEAEKAYSRSIELRPFAHFDQVKRAMIRVEEKNLTGAQADVDALKSAGASWPIVGHVDGYIAFSQNDFETAQTKFQEVLSKAPGFPPTQNLLGIIYYENGNYINAEKLLSEYLSTNPNEPRARLVYATTLLRLNRIDEAHEAIKPLEKVAPDNPQILSLLGNIYLAKGERKSAIAVLEKSVKLAPENAGSRARLGTILLQDKNTYSKGQAQLSKAIELDPKLHRAELALFLSYMQEKKFTKARDFATNVSKNNKSNSQGFNMVAMSYLGEGKDDQAKAALRQALQEFPADPDTSHNLGRMLIREKDYEGAKSLYQAVLDKNDGHLTALNQLALISAREGKQDEMLSYLKTAQEKNPQQLSARILLANQYLRSNKTNDAIQLLNDASAVDKQNTSYIMTMATAKLAAGESNHAIRSLKALTKKEPLPGAGFLLARAYGMEKKPKEMRRALEEVLKIAPEHFGAGLVLARLELVEGNYDAFKSIVGRLVEQYPDNADVQFLKAKAESGDQNYAEAVGTLTEMLERTPNTNVAIDLARNQWRAGDHDGATTGLEVWMQDNPDDHRVKFELAQFYLADKKYNDAIEAYEDLAVKVPDNSVVLNNLAWLLIDIDTKKAINYAEKALTLSPDSPAVKDTVAMLYLKNGDNSKALELSGQAATDAPNIFDIQINYSRVLRANGKAEQARALLNQLEAKVNDASQKKIIQEELAK